MCGGTSGDTGEPFFKAFTFFCLCTKPSPPASLLLSLCNDCIKATTLSSGALASWLCDLILGLRCTYHSHAKRITAPSASYGVGISEYPGRAVGWRTYTAEQVAKDTSMYAGIYNHGEPYWRRKNGLALAALV